MKITMSESPGLPGLSSAQGIEVFGLDDSPLSPLFPCCIPHDGYEFNSIVQVIAYEKAKFTGAIDLAKAVAANPDPNTSRTISRQLAISNQARWQTQENWAMKTATIAKLLHTPLCMNALAQTKGLTLAFGVRGDTIWGAGITADEISILHQQSWPGKNEMGGLLMSLRDGYFREIVDLLQPRNAGAVVELTDDKKSEVIQLSRAFFDLAEDLYDIEFPDPTYRFDLRGRTAGQAIMGLEGTRQIRYNSVLLSENWAGFRRRTIPHEVAHVVAYGVFGRNEGGGHGDRWKQVMHSFGCESSRCHSYDTSRSTIHAGKRHLMHCKCKAHLVSASRSAKLLKCTMCGAKLEFAIMESELLKEIEEEDE